MTVGDPKKAIVLAVIAVAIVTVAAFRMIPSQATPQKPVASPGATAGTDAPAKPTDSPPTPAVDSFSHPNLASKDEARKLPTAAVKKPAEPAVGPYRIKTDGVLPGVAASPDPGENTGIDQQDSKEGLILIRLDAVVRGTSSMALITIAGQSKQVGEGATINEHIKVLKIRESSIVITASGKPMVIEVGQEAKI